MWITPGDYQSGVSAAFNKASAVNYVDSPWLFLKNIPGATCQQETSLGAFSSVSKYFIETQQRFSWVTQAHCVWKQTYVHQQHENTKVTLVRINITFTLAVYKNFIHHFQSFNRSTFGTGIVMMLWVKNSTCAVPTPCLERMHVINAVFFLSGCVWISHTEMQNTQ